MNPTEQMKRQQQYKTYVDQKTPRHNLWLNMLRAFLTGGAVCVLGQIIFNLCELQKLSQDDCSNWTSMLLVLISVILTEPEFIRNWQNGAVQELWFRLPVSPILLPHLPLNTKKKARSLVSDARSSPSPGLLYFMGFSQAGFSACSTGCGG